MKIAITGGTGFIGSALIEEALSAGHEVVALTRKKPKNNSHFIVVDFSDSSSLNSAIEGCHAVIHLAAAMQGSDQYQQTLNLTQQLLDAMDAAQVKRLILTSSISVLDYTQLKPMSQIDENLDYCYDDEKLGNYAQMKRDQELQCKKWLTSAFEKELVIVRPGLVYDDTQLSDAHAGFIKKGFGLTSIHSGNVPLVHVRKVAEGLLKVSTQENIDQEIIQLIDSSPISQKEYLQQLSQKGLKLAIPLPWKVYSLFSFFIRRALAIIGQSNKIPDAFRENSVAARQKPFRFKSSKKV